MIRISSGKKLERLTDSELKMTGNDTGLLVVTGSISSQLEDFGCKVLKNRREIDRGSSSDTEAKKGSVSIICIKKGW